MMFDQWLKTDLVMPRGANIYRRHGKEPGKVTGKVAGKVPRESQRFLKGRPLLAISIKERLRSSKNHLNGFVIDGCPLLAISKIQTENAIN